MPESGTQEDMFSSAMAACGPAIARLVRGYEFDGGRQDELSQEIQVALWRSFAVYDGRCSLRTWTFRIAHNVAVSHIAKARRSRRSTWISLEDIAELPQQGDAETALGEALALERIRGIVRSLRPPDAQIVLLWLEGEEAAAIAEITGVTSGAVATKISRIKAALARHFQQSQFQEGGPDND